MHAELAVENDCKVWPTVGHVWSLLDLRTFNEKHSAPCTQTRSWRVPFKARNVIALLLSRRFTVSSSYCPSIWIQHNVADVGLNEVLQYNIAKHVDVWLQRDNEAEWDVPILQHCLLKARPRSIQRFVLSICFNYNVPFWIAALVEAWHLTNTC